jgi:hypothetical protein
MRIHGMQGVRQALGMYAKHVAADYASDIPKHDQPADEAAEGEDDGQPYPAAVMPQPPPPQPARAQKQTQRSLADFNVTEATNLSSGLVDQLLAPAGGNVAAGFKFFCKAHAIGCQQVPNLVDAIIEVGPADDADPVHSNSDGDDSDSESESDASDSDDDDAAAPASMMQGFVVPGTSLIQRVYEDICFRFVVCTCQC